MRKLCRTGGLGLGALALAGGLFLFGVFQIRAAKISEAGNPIVPVQINDTLIQAEVVSSPEKLYLGLGGRRHLARGNGMLFIMPTYGMYAFCMRGMLISIDIIWISGNRIIGFQQNLGPQDQGEFLPPAPVDLVLEVPAGFVKAAGFRVGDGVKFLEGQ